MDHSCYGVSLYILTISPLLGVGLAKNLSHFCWLPFSCLCCPLPYRLISFTNSHLLIDAISVCAISVLFSNLSPMPVFSRLFLVFSTICFRETGFYLHELDFVQGEGYESVYIFLHVDI